MPDRLQELLRQKALLSEHAAWLEREIALEQARVSGAPPAAAAETPAPVTGPPAAIADGTDALQDQFRREPKAIRREVTRGCLFYFLGFMVLLGMGVAAIYLIFRHR